MKTIQNLNWKSLIILTAFVALTQSCKDETVDPIPADPTPPKEEEVILETSPLTGIQVICASYPQSNYISFAWSNWITENGKKNFSTKVKKITFLDDKNRILDVAKPVGKEVATITGDEYGGPTWYADIDSRWHNIAAGDVSIYSPIKEEWKNAPVKTPLPLREGVKYAVEVTAENDKVFRASCTIPHNEYVFSAWPPVNEPVTGIYPPYEEVGKLSGIRAMCANFKDHAWFALNNWMTESGDANYTIKLKKVTFIDQTNQRVLNTATPIGIEAGTVVGDEYGGGSGWSGDTDTRWHNLGVDSFDLYSPTGEKWATRPVADFGLKEGNVYAVEAVAENNQVFRASCTMPKQGTYVFGAMSGAANAGTRLSK